MNKVFRGEHTKRSTARAFAITIAKSARPPCGGFISNRHRPQRNPPPGLNNSIPFNAISMLTRTSSSRSGGVARDCMKTSMLVPHGAKIVLLGTTRS